MSSKNTLVESPNEWKFCLAPMMKKTDRHFRYLISIIAPKMRLYTEMITPDAIIYGNRARFLGHSKNELPLALQLGGANPESILQSALLAVKSGFNEINLNCGCPSDRVQSGAFGAVLMQQPGLVADCVDAMRAACDVEVTVKCRIGVDDQVPEEILPEFLARIVAAGCTRVTIHARKAWLQGLSPKENRDIPPLDYDLVHQMKGLFPNLHISVNGGITSLDQAEAFLDAGLDGVMVGRSAYHAPTDILASADRRIFGQGADSSAEAAVQGMLPYIEAHLASGGRLGQITRHMLGLFAGRPGARHWRRILSEGAHKPGAGPELVEAALAEVAAAQEIAAAG